MWVFSRQRWTMRWTARWTFAMWTVLCTTLICGEVDASVGGCPTINGGRVVCLQAQLCTPGQPLAGPGCGPGLSQVCCLKTGSAIGPPPGPRVGPFPGPPPRPPPPGPPPPWRPDNVKPWPPRPRPPQPWRPDQSNAVIPDPSPSWQWDRPGPELPQPQPPSPPVPVPSAPPLPSLPPSPPTAAPSVRPEPPTVLPSVAPSSEPLLQCGRVQEVAKAGVRRRGRSAEGLLGVTGGRDADGSLWPWAALLGERDAASGQRWFCGAVLVSPSALLTAAHCVAGRNASDLLVRLGEYDLSTDSERQTQDLQPAAVSIHPGYAAGGARPARAHDLAVIRLQRPATLGPFVQPVCLPPTPQPAGRLTGQPVALAGWGLTEFAGSQSDVLQEADLRVVAPDVCEEAYRQLPSFDISFPDGFNGYVLCATGGEGELAKDACSGDSGGPLVWRAPAGSYQLVGVVSAGVGCGNPEFPGLYTRVAAHLDWIRQNI